MKEDKVKHGAFRVTLVIDPAHGRDIDSRNTPKRRDVYSPLLAAELDLWLERELVNGCLLSREIFVNKTYTWELYITE